jgi:hypothetical protein
MEGLFSNNDLMVYVHLVHNEPTLDLFSGTLSGAFVIQRRMFEWFAYYLKGILQKSSIV